MDHDRFARVLGEKLRTARRRRGLTQAALADTAFSKSFVSQVEHGRIHPSLSSLQHFSERLGVRLSTLLGEPTEWELAAHLADLALELGMPDDAERLLGMLDRYRPSADEHAHRARDVQCRLAALRHGALALIRGDVNGADRLLQQVKQDSLTWAEDEWWEGAHAMLWEGRLALAQEKPLWAARAWEGCLQLCDNGARRARAEAQRAQPSRRARRTSSAGGGRATAEGSTAHPPWKQPDPLKARAQAHLTLLHHIWDEERPASDRSTRPRTVPEPLVASAKTRVQWAAHALDAHETRQAEYWAAQADALLWTYEARRPEWSAAGVGGTLAAWLPANFRKESIGAPYDRVATPSPGGDDADRA